MNQPIQRDLLTGELEIKPAKKGRGNRHIKLTLDTSTRVVVPGMASYAGEGPPGTYCRDCEWLGTVKVERPDLDTCEVADRACVQWALRMGHAAPNLSKHDISLCNSCAVFSAAPTMARTFHIDSAGNLRPV